MRVRWSCGRCGRRGTAPIEARVHFHQCTPRKPPRRRAIRLREPEGFTREEARNQVWDGLAEALDALDPEWAYRKETA
jgi:hypothetical protein